MSILFLRSSASVSSLAADWLARSTAANVVWAQRFTSDANVSKYIVYGTGRTLASIVPGYKFCDVSDGILGDGCLTMRSPTGDDQAGAGSWMKPFLPITGVDINNAGVATMSDFTNIQADGVFDNTSLGGYFTQSGTGTRVIGNEFWLQYFAKVSSNRFAASQPRGKNLFLTVNFLGTAAQEIVCDYEVDYGGKWLSFYTNPGDWNTLLRDPQRASGDDVNGDMIQNQAPWDSTCIVGNLVTNNCRQVIPGQWFSMLIHVIVGSQKNSASLSDPLNPNDQTLEVYVADHGETSYSPILRKSNFQFDFQANAGQAALGYNLMGFTDFTGGGSEIPANETFDQKYDQVILTKGSTMPACPQVWPA